MLVKLNIVTKSPAAALPKLKKNGPSTVMPVSKDIVFKLLNSVDRSTWMENRNYLILSLLWALGLRISEVIHPNALIAVANALFLSFFLPAWENRF